MKCDLYTQNSCSPAEPIYALLYIIAAPTTARVKAADVCMPHCHTHSGVLWDDTVYYVATAGAGAIEFIGNP